MEICIFINTDVCFNKSVNAVLLFTIDWAYTCTYANLSKHVLYILVTQYKICNLRLVVLVFFIQNWKETYINYVIFEIGIKFMTISNIHMKSVRLILVQTRW